jgi:hypothetical protein
VDGKMCGSEGEICAHNVACIVGKVPPGRTIGELARMFVCSHICLPSVFLHTLVRHIFSFFLFENLHLINYIDFRIYLHTIIPIVCLYANRL